MRCCASCAYHSRHYGRVRLYRQSASISGVFPYCENVPHTIASGHRWSGTDIFPVVLGTTNVLRAGAVAEYDPGLCKVEDAVPEKLELPAYLPDVSGDFSNQQPPVGLFADCGSSGFLQPNLAARTDVALCLGWAVTPSRTHGTLSWSWLKFKLTNDRFPPLTGFVENSSVTHPFPNDLATVKNLLSRVGFVRQRVRRGVLVVSRDDGGSEIARHTGDELADLWEIAVSVYRREDLKLVAEPARL